MSVPGPPRRPPIQLQQHPPPPLQEQVMETVPVTSEPAVPQAEAGMGYTSDPAHLIEYTTSPPESHTLQLDTDESEEEVFLLPDVSSASAEEEEIPVTPTATADTSPPIYAEPTYEPPLQTVISPELETAIHSLSSIGSPVLSDSPDLGPSHSPSPYLPSAAIPQRGNVAGTQYNATMPAYESSPVSPINPDQSIAVRSPTSPTSPTSPKSPTSSGDFNKPARKLSVENVVLQPTRATSVEVSCTSSAPKVSKVEVRSLTRRQSESKNTPAESSHSQSGTLPKKVVTAQIQPLPASTSTNDKGERDIVTASINKDVNAGKTEVKNTPGAQIKREVKIAMSSVKTPSSGAQTKVTSKTTNIIETKGEPSNMRQSQLVMNVGSSGGSKQSDKTQGEMDQKNDNNKVNTKCKMDTKSNQNSGNVSKQNSVNVHRNETKLSINSAPAKTKDIVNGTDSSKSLNLGKSQSEKLVKQSTSKIETVADKKQKSPESAPEKVASQRVSQVGTKSVSSRTDAYLTQSKSNQKEPVKTKSPTAKTGTTSQTLSQSSLPKKIPEAKVHTSSVKILGPSRAASGKLQSAVKTSDKVMKIACHPGGHY